MPTRFQLLLWFPITPKRQSTLLMLEFWEDVMQAIQLILEEEENNDYVGLQSFMTALLMPLHNLVDQIVGATPKGVLRVMGVPGITIYHVKSHLQKYRLAKYLPESPAEGSKDDKKDSGDTLSNMETGTGMQINDTLKMQMEVQKRLHEQLEVQRQLQLRIEAQGKYLQKIIEEQQRLGGALKACEETQQPAQHPSTSQDSHDQPSTPLKKPRVDDQPSMDPALAPSEVELKPGFTGHWNQDLYSGSDVGLRFDADMDLEEGKGNFKQQEQPRPVEIAHAS